MYELARIWRQKVALKTFDGRKSTLGIYGGVGGVPELSEAILIDQTPVKGSGSPGEPHLEQTADFSDKSSTYSYFNMRLLISRQY